ncbi:hypothetical protein BO71DRAFT_397475, partial [Aspergillus ellipticus CBS 707.79]
MSVNRSPTPDSEPPTDRKHRHPELRNHSTPVRMSDMSATNRRNQHRTLPDYSASTSVGT